MGVQAQHETLPAPPHAPNSCHPVDKSSSAAVERGGGWAAAAPLHPRALSMRQGIPNSLQPKFRSHEDGLGVARDSFMMGLQYVIRDSARLPLTAVHALIHAHITSKMKSEVTTGL